MFTRFEPTKSTKGASKMRRDLINAEIANLRDLLPLPPSTRQRLSQLQLMALICVYVRKANYFQQVLKCHDFTHHYHHHAPTPNIGFSKALNGFLMMMTQNGKLLYISDNAAEYLGHSMEDLLIHGDSVYDIIDKQDHAGVQAELCRPASSPQGPPATPAPQGSPHDTRMFLCRINVARNARRQMRFGDQKVVLVRGHFLSFLPLCSRNEPVFLAACSPVAMPETRECVVQGATNVFTTIHSMDMKIKHVDSNGCWYLGWDKSDLVGVSWYQLLHWECMREAQSKHRLITQSEQERSCILLLRLQKHSGDWLWVHAVLQVKDNMENNQQPVIVCTNQVLSESEAIVMLGNSWLYHYYSVQSKLQYGLPYDAPPQSYYPGGSAPPYHDGGGPLYEEGGNPAVAPSVGPHGHHLQLPHQGFGYEGTLAERGPVDYSRHSALYANDRYVPQAELCMRLQDPRSNTPAPSTPPSSSLPHHQGSGGSSGGIRLHRKRKHSQSQNQTLTRLEPLHISPTSKHIIVDSGGGGTLLALSHSQPERRNPMKPGLEDPADFIDRWNPSPPWSDTALQKVPQVYQELSYISSAPLTPTGTPSGVSGYNGLQNTFTFDWLPEHYVGHQPQPVLHIVCRDEDYEREKATQSVQSENSTHQSVTSEGNVQPS